MTRGQILVVTGCLALWFVSAASEPISKPIAHNDQLKNRRHMSAEELTKKAEELTFAGDGSEVLRSKECPLDHYIAWHQEFPSSVYTSPRIYDLFSDRKKDVLVSTFVRNVEALHGEDGHSVMGWPYMFMDSIFHTSPLIHDRDHDGVPEAVFVTGNGEIIFIRENGMVLFGETLKVPKLRVRKDWYVNLKDEHAEGKHADHQHETEDTLLEAMTAEEGMDIDDGPQDEKVGALTDDSGARVSGSGKGKGRNRSAAAGTGGSLSDEGLASMRELFDDTDNLGDYSLNSYKDGHIEDPLWSPYHEPQARDKNFVLLDAHVLADPVITDLDGDGRDDLIVSVSYFFDREEYSDHGRYANIDPDVDISKYVAGGVVVFDLTTNKIKWSIHLDLSTDDTRLRAFIYSSPTVADLDNDGRLEVILGTSLGFLYVIKDDGTTMPGFPIEMAEIQGQIAVADMNDDGILEMVVVDSNNEVRCISHKGKALWVYDLAGFSAQVPSIADINGDGQLDVVVASVTGHIAALNGKTGKALDHFPFKTDGRILSPVTVTHLSKLDSSSKDDMHLLVPAFDGYIYVINGRTGCADKIDVGEHMYGQVLVDDVTGNGKLDLIAATMNGNVYCYGTSIPFRSESVVLGPTTTFVPRSYMGVYVTDLTRSQAEVSGPLMHVEFTIVDNRKKRPQPGEYTVTIWIGGTIPLMKQVYHQPGTYRESLYAPARRQDASLVIKMVTDTGVVFTDYWSVAFNITFYRQLKFALLVPFTLLFGAVVLVRVKPADLPSVLPSFT